MERDSRPSVAYLGPAGTYSHQAAYSYFGDSVRFEASPDIASAFNVLSDTVPFACIPLANSTHGPVIETFNLLRSERWGSEVLIRDEITIAIEHCLVAAGREDARSRGLDEERPWDLNKVETVYSHEQALGQCASWLAKHLPRAKRIRVDSTAEGARRLSSSKDTQDGRAVAICSEICTRAYPGLRIVHRGVQDRKDNQTRFIIMGWKDAASPVPRKQGLSRSLLRIEVKNGLEPSSSLARALALLTQASTRVGFSVVRIDRRPSLSGSLWSDNYFIELKSEANTEGLWHYMKEEANQLGVVLGIW